MENHKFYCFNSCHFEIPLYRLPIVPLCLTFIPFWLLGLISLFIFFTPTNFDVRVYNVGMVMLAYIAFLPVIRSQLPENPRITLIEILLYLEIVATIICMIESYRVRYHENSEPFLWKKSAFFFICLFIQVGEFFIFLGLMLAYWLRWKPSYKIKAGLVINLNIAEWLNPACDAYFREKMKKT